MIIKDGKWLDLARERTGISFLQLGLKSGVSRAMINKLHTGALTGTTEMWEKIYTYYPVYGVTFEQNENNIAIAAKSKKNVILAFDVNEDGIYYVEVSDQRHLNEIQKKYGDNYISISTEQAVKLLEKQRDNFRWNNK